MYGQLDIATLLILLAVAAIVIVHGLISARSIRALAGKTAAQPLSDAKLALYLNQLHSYRNAVLGKDVEAADGADQVNLALLAGVRVVEACSKLDEAIDADRSATVIAVRFNALVEEMRNDLGVGDALARKLDAAAIVAGADDGRKDTGENLANGHA
jgi:hypothetical protein